MRNKMMGAHYPGCSSNMRVFSKHQDVSGEFEVIGKELKFNAKFLFAMKLNSKSFTIPLNEILKVETMNLNGVMPFGVCLFMADGSEIMIGHMNNKKLAAFIEDARNGMFAE